MIGNGLSNPDMLLFESRNCDVFLQSMNFRVIFRQMGIFDHRTIMSGRHHAIHQHGKNMGVVLTTQGRLENPPRPKWNPFAETRS